MRKALVIVMLALCAAAALPAAFGEDGDTDKKFQITGDIRTRWERLDNYFDLQDSKDTIPGSDDAFSFFPYRIRLGVNGELADNVQAVLELQNFGSWGNQSPNQSFGFPPFQNFDGDGQNSGFRSSETSIYQAIIKLNNIGGSPVSVSIGRQESAFGTGLILGNEDYYNGTVYDGVHATWDLHSWQLSGMYYQISERNDFANNSFSGFSADDQTLFGFVASFHPELGKMKTHLDGYLFNEDERLETQGRPNFWTLGGHWWRTADTKADVDDSPIDWNLEVAIQDGNGTDPTNGEDFDLGGMILEASIGWNFASEKHHQRVHAGAIYESGDDDVTDNDLHGWNRLFPQLHGRYGDVDFMSSISFGPFAGVPSGIWAPSIGYSIDCRDGRHKFYTNLYVFKPVEDSIRISSTEKFKVKDFGKEIDAYYDYAYSKHVTLSAGVGYFKPDSEFGDLLGNVDPNTGDPSDDPVTRVTAGARVRF